MWNAQDLLPALPEDLEPLVVEQRPRTVLHHGQSHDIEDSTLFARRRP
jgi:hypothetical protein